MKAKIFTLLIPAAQLLAMLTLVLLGLATLDVPKEIAYWRLAIGLILLWSALSLSELSFDSPVPPVPTQKQEN